jgi:LL-diaminopimelate aminotransferase
VARINEHYLKLAGAYLFPEIARRVEAFASSSPDAASRIIRCGVGDVTEALPPAVIAAMHAAVDDMGRRETFRGYGPPYGYDFLREAIAEGDFRSRGIAVELDEIIVSDGSKIDCGAVLEIFAGGRPADGGNRIGIPDPVYPVYVDTNVMAGNTGPALEGGGYESLVALPCTADNDFVPVPPDEALDVVYLCFPNNPTGGMIDRPRLEAWVAWALRHDAVVLYDVAYADFIRDPDLPRSIYEIPGARRCAMEFHSFSKNGGFTGVRCGYTVCPRELQGRTRDGRSVSMLDLWRRRWSTRSNGVPYVVQRAAEAIYSEAGRRETAALIDGYMANASALADACRGLGLRVFGGDHAPYVWVECPDGLDSWGVFDRMLEELQVVITPGSGFGRLGEGWFRISAFNTPENVAEVVRRMQAAGRLVPAAPA